MNYVLNGKKHKLFASIGRFYWALADFHFEERIIFNNFKARYKFSRFTGFKIAND